MKRLLIILLIISPFLVQGQTTGCSDPSAENYFCNTPAGQTACVFQGLANGVPIFALPPDFVDDGSCLFPGCTDSTADNYDSTANTDDGSCVISGCLNSVACNYNPLATINVNSCIYAETYYDCDDVCLNDSDGDGVCNELEVSGCTDSDALNFNEYATDDDGTCIAAVLGCTDPTAFNYDNAANVDDSS